MIQIVMLVYTILLNLFILIILGVTPLMGTVTYTEIRNPLIVFTVLFFMQLTVLKIIVDNHIKKQ